jgi:hypothetical protein
MVLSPAANGGGGMVLSPAGHGAGRRQGFSQVVKNSLNGYITWHV